MAQPTLEEQYETEVRRQQLWHQRQREEDLARQQPQKRSRMSLGIFLTALILGLIADVAELFTAGTLGWFVGFFIDLILLAMLGISKAGRNQWKKWIWGPVVEKVPILDAVPLFRAVFLTWSFVSSRSEKLQQVSKIVSLGKAKK